MCVFCAHSWLRYVFTVVLVSSVCRYCIVCLRFSSRAWNFSANRIDRHTDTIIVYFVTIFILFIMIIITMIIIIIIIIICGFCRICLYGRHIGIYIK